MHSVSGNLQYDLNKGLCCSFEMNLSDKNDIEISPDRGFVSCKKLQISLYMFSIPSASPANRN
jgi:hypothetical protein